MPDFIATNIRLSFRVEGDMWNAYAAQLNTMDEAILLGSISMIAVHDNPAREAAFVAMIRGICDDLFAAAFGARPEWSLSHLSPDHDCS